MDFNIVISGLSGTGVLTLVIERLLQLRKEKKNGGTPSEQILQQLQDLNDKSESIEKEVGLASKDMGIVRNELENINKRCSSHIQTQAEINKSVSISISKNVDKIFELAKKEK